MQFRAAVDLPRRVSWLRFDLSIGRSGASSHKPLARVGRFHRCIHEEAVVKIGSETSAGFSRHPFGIILSKCVAGERQEMRFGDSHSG